MPKSSPGGAPAAQQVAGVETVAPAGCEKASSITSADKNILCVFFAQGKCTKGEECPYSHEKDTSKLPICRFFTTKKGCKYGNHCRYVHVGVPPNRAASQSKSVKKKKRKKETTVGDRDDDDSPEGAESALAVSRAHVMLKPHCVGQSRVSILRLSEY